VIMYGKLVRTEKEAAMSYRALDSLKKGEEN
jgi:hypothetical protein